jgi:hypothetical protein
MNFIASLSNTNTSSTHKTPIIKLSNSFEEVVPMLITIPHVFFFFCIPSIYSFIYLVFASKDLTYAIFNLFFGS